jgi:alpha-tubulin suppressor-like RCC1 family protein
MATNYKQYIIYHNGIKHILYYNNGVQSDLFGRTPGIPGYVAPKKITVPKYTGPALRQNIRSHIPKIAAQIKSGSQYLSDKVKSLNKNHADNEISECKISNTVTTSGIVSVSKKSYPKSIIALQSTKQYIYYTSGDNTSYQFGHDYNTSFNRFSENYFINDIVDWDTGKNHSIGIDISGNIVLWGTDAFEIYDNNDIIIKTVVLNAFTTPSVTLLANISSSLISSDTISGSTTHQSLVGTITEVSKIFCSPYSYHMLINGYLVSWGGNFNKGLGLNITDDNISVGKVVNTITDGGGNYYLISDFSCKHLHSAALLTDGSIMFWGSNIWGQLGLNPFSYTNVTTPFVNGGFTDVKKIKTGENHTVLLNNDGTVWGCGSNMRGQLGITGQEFTFVFRLLDIADVDDIDVGSNHTMFLKDNTVYVCGSNDYGQLGIAKASCDKLLKDNVQKYLDDNPGLSSSAVTTILENEDYYHYYLDTITIIPKFKELDSIYAGYDNSFAIDKTKKLYSWGLNNKNQLGIGYFENIFIPTKVNIKFVDDVKSGHNFSFIQQQKPTNLDYSDYC